MIRGARALGLPPPAHARFIAAAETAVRDAGLAGARAAVRVTYTAGSGGRGLDRPVGLRPRLFATAAPQERPRTPARLWLASPRRNEVSPTSRLKTLAYLDNVLARAEARAAGADEAVMLNTKGEVAGAAAANIAWVKDGALVTPAADAGRLDGVMLSLVLEAAARLRIEAREVVDGVGAVRGADAVLLTSSLIGVRAAWLGGERQAPPHPIAAALAAAVEPYA